MLLAYCTVQKPMSARSLTARSRVPPRFPLSPWVAERLSGAKRSFAGCPTASKVLGWHRRLKSMPADAHKEQSENAQKAVSIGKFEETMRQVGWTVVGGTAQTQSRTGADLEHDQVRGHYRIGTNPGQPKSQPG